VQKFKEPEAEVKQQFIRKLSCRKEATRCWVSLEISLSLKVTQSHSNLHRWVRRVYSCYLSSIVNMAIYCIISELKQDTG